MLSENSSLEERDVSQSGHRVLEAQKETTFAKATFCQGVSHPRQDFLRHVANVSRRNTGTAQGLCHITPSLVGPGGVSGNTPSGCADREYASSSHWPHTKACKDSSQLHLDARARMRRRSMSDFRSSRTNHKGSQASPKHLSSGQNVAHSPKGWGVCVCGGDGVGAVGD